MSSVASLPLIIMGDFFNLVPCLNNIYVYTTFQRLSVSVFRYIERLPASETSHRRIYYLDKGQGKKSSQNYT
jgi:hypothetical protein